MVIWENSENFLAITEYFHFPFFLMPWSKLCFTLNSLSDNVSFDVVVLLSCISLLPLGFFVVLIFDFSS